MRNVILCLGILLWTGSAVAQDFSVCETKMAPLQARIAALQKQLPEGYTLEFQCLYSGTARENKKVPVRHIALRPNEIKLIHELRSNANAAAAALDAYMDYLIAAHGLKAPTRDDPCFWFVGFVLDDDFITDDPNPFMPWTCPRGPRDTYYRIPLAETVPAYQSGK